MQRISVRVVWRDLNHVLDVMMIYAFGVDGVKPKGEQAHSSPSQPR